MVVRGAGLVVLLSHRVSLGVVVVVVGTVVVVVVVGMVVVVVGCVAHYPVAAV